MLNMEKNDDPMGVGDDDGCLNLLQATMETTNAASCRCLRRMTRSQRRTIASATRAMEALAHAKIATANAQAAKASGIKAGVLSPAREAVSTTREALAIAMAALNDASAGHGLARERSQHALAVGMCAETALTKFIEQDEGSLEEAA